MAQSLLGKQNTVNGLAALASGLNQALGDYSFSSGLSTQANGRPLFHVAS